MSSTKFSLNHRNAPVSKLGHLHELSNACLYDRLLEARDSVTYWQRQAALRTDAAGQTQARVRVMVWKQQLAAVEAESAARAATV